MNVSVPSTSAASGLISEPRRSDGAVYSHNTRQLTVDDVANLVCCFQSPCSSLSPVCTPLELVPADSQLSQAQNRLNKAAGCCAASSQVAMAHAPGAACLFPVHHDRQTPAWLAAAPDFPRDSVFLFTATNTAVIPVICSLCLLAHCRQVSELQLQQSRQKHQAPI